MFLGTKKNKALMKTATTVALVASAIVAPVAEASSFKDVSSSHQFYAEILHLQQRGVIHGFPDGTFKPGQSVTRGQAAKIIVGVLGLNTTTVANPNFKDIPTTHQYYGAVAALKQAGIISGKGDGTYGVNEPMQRNHLAKIVATAFELKAETTTLPFSDVRDDYRAAIAALYEHGITSGTTKTTFSGASNVTRGQLAAFLTRTERLKNAPEKPPVTPTELRFTLQALPTNGKLTVAGTTYTLTPAAAAVFAQTNARALTKAEVKATVKDGVIQTIDALTLTQSGTARAPVKFLAASVGALTVNADYVEVKNITVAQDLIVAKEAATSLLLDEVAIGGKLLVEQPSRGGAILPIAPLTVTLQKTIPQQMVIARDNTRVVTDQKLPQLTLAAAVQALDTTGPLGNVVVEGTGKLKLTGKSEIDELTIGHKELELALTGVIAKLTVTEPNAKITLGPNVKITSLLVPQGKTAADVVVNYQQVLGQIGGSKAGGGSRGGTSGKGDFTLSIMHHNDLHANLDNVPKTVTAVKEYRAQKPNALLLNAGDVFSGTLYFNTFEGQADLALFKYLGYDAMTFGNHEFDLGSSAAGHQALVDFIKGADFPFVSANVDFTADSRFTGLFSDLIASNPSAGKIYRGIVKEVDGEKVGIFGLTTEETKSISSPGSVTFSNYVDEANKAVKAFEGMGVNKIIALTHIGYDDNPAVDNDLLLAQHVDGIDVIVGGHSHTTLSTPIIINKKGDVAKEPTIIVQAGEYNKYLGTVDVTFNNQGVVVNVNGQLIEIGKQLDDAQALATLKPYKDKIAEIASLELGVTLAQPLDNPRATSTSTWSVRANETILGNIITDGMLAKAKQYDKDVVLALQNGGGIRAPINAGPVTVGEVINVLPFGNTLATMLITGAELKTAFETSLKSYPGESGGFLHIAGGKVEFDSTKPAGQRVVAVYVKDGATYKPLDDQTTYKVATNAFTAKGGDGYAVFEALYKAGKVNDLGLSDWENLREHLLAIKNNIPTTLEGRIVDVASVRAITAADVQGGTATNPVVIPEHALVNLTDVGSLQHIVFEGDVTLTGTLAAGEVISNVKVKGRVDATGLHGQVTLTGIEASSIEL